MGIQGGWLGGCRGREARRLGGYLNKGDVGVLGKEFTALIVLRTPCWTPVYEPTNCGCDHTSVSSLSDCQCLSVGGFLSSFSFLSTP